MSESEPSALGTGLGPALADYIPFMPSGARRAGAASLMAERIGQDPGVLLKNPIISQLLATSLGGATGGAARALGASKPVTIGAAILPLLAVQVMKRHRIKSIQRDYDTEERKRLREVGSLDEVLDGNVGSRRLGLARAYEAMRTRKLRNLGPLTEAADVLPIAGIMSGIAPQLTLPVTQTIDHLAANKIQKEAAMLRRALGRVVTNVVEPYGYSVGGKWQAIKKRGLLKNVKAVIKDEPAYDLGTNYTTRDLPYRRMFGLPAHRGGIGNYTKNGPGSFRLSGRKPGSMESLENVATQASAEAREAGPLPKGGMRFAGDDPPTMTGYDGRILPGDIATYRDRWDFDLNRGESPTSSVSNLMRHAFSKVTKPVTIEGSINHRTLQNNPLGKQAAFSDQDSVPAIPLFLAAALGSTLSNEVLGNVATSRWSKNTIPRDQWGGLINEVSGKRPVVTSAPNLNNGYFRNVDERHGDVEQLVGNALSDPQNQKDFGGRPSLKQLMLGQNPGRDAAKNIRDQMLNNGMIQVDPELASPALLAHEAGHARISHDKGSLSNWLQDNAYRHSNITAPLTGMGGMAAGLGLGGPLKGLLAGAGIGLLGNAGTLIPEAMASYYGDRGLRQHRGGALQNDRGAQLAALGTYATMLAGPAALSGLLGGWVSSRRKKNLITGDEDAEKQANWRRKLLSGVKESVRSDGSEIYARLRTGNAPATVRRLSDYENTLGLDVLAHDTYTPGGAFSAFRATVPAPLRGLGIGRKLYGDAIRQAFERYRSSGQSRYFTSSHTGNTSDDAVNLWGALKRRGYPVRDGGPEQSRFSIDMADMAKFYSRTKSAADFSNIRKMWHVINHVKSTGMSGNLADSYARGEVGRNFTPLYRGFFKDPAVTGLGIHSRLRRSQIGKIIDQLQDAPPAPAPVNVPEVPKPVTKLVQGLLGL